MEKIDIELFSQLMASDGKYAAINVELVSGNKVYRIEKSANMSFVIEGGVPSLHEDSVSYTLQDGDGKRRVFFTKEEMLSYVKDNFVSDGKIAVNSIDGCSSAEQFMHMADFNDYNMEQLLEKYADCDEFSLTCDYNVADEKSPHGKYRLDRKTGDNAYRLIEFEQHDMCKALYAYAPEEEKKSLPPFDKLYADITAEVKELYSLVKERPLFTGDMYSEGKMKYKGESALLHHMYHSAGFLQDCKGDLAAQYKNTLTRPADAEFDKEEFAPLKPYIGRVLVTYCWHCTVSDKLAKVFYIKLNDQTKQWLMQFKNDYALEGLEDLAFYKNGECRFSSCTHERFHTDLTDKN